MRRFYGLAVTGLVAVSACASEPEPRTAFTPPTEVDRLERCASVYGSMVIMMKEGLPARQVAAERSAAVTAKLATAANISADEAATHIRALSQHRVQASDRSAMTFALELASAQGCDRQNGYPLLDPVPPGSPPPVPLDPQPPRRLQ